MDTSTRPVWTTAEPGWPTRSEHIERAALGVPVDWQPVAPLPPARGVTETVFVGPLPGELLAVATMPEADPSHDLRQWVDVVLAVVGVPHPALAPATILSWTVEGEQPGWATDLTVDTCLTYQGMLVNGTDLTRCYVVLARRGTTAWRILLTLASALPPGAPDDEVEANDHVRAAAVLAGLRLG